MDTNTPIQNTSEIINLKESSGQNNGGNRVLRVVLTTLLITTLAVASYFNYVQFNTNSDLNNKVTQLNKELEELKSKEMKENDVQLLTYKNTEIKLEFKYPSDWETEIVKSAETEYQKDITTLYVTSPSGSQFIHYKATFKGQGYGVEEGCDSKDPEGKNSDSVLKCTFVGNFARYNPNVQNSNPNEWLIAEKSEDSDSLYTHWPFDNYKYIVKDSKDLAILDEIMKSVVNL